MASCVAASGQVARGAEVDPRDTIMPFPAFLAGGPTLWSHFDEEIRDSSDLMDENAIPTSRVDRKKCTITASFAPAISASSFWSLNRIAPRSLFSTTRQASADRTQKPGPLMTLCYRPQSRVSHHNQRRITLSNNSTEAQHPSGTCQRMIDKLANAGCPRGGRKLSSPSQWDLLVVAGRPQRSSSSRSTKSVPTGKTDPEFSHIHPLPLSLACLQKIAR